MALTGYRKAGTDDVRCLDHVDFQEGTPVYGEVECTYCAMKQAKAQPIEAEPEVEVLKACTSHRFVPLVHQRGDRVICHYEVKKRLLANPVQEVSVDDRPSTGAFRVAQLSGWAMIHRGNYWGQYMGGSEAGARAHMRNLRRRAQVQQCTCGYILPSGTTRCTQCDDCG